MKNKEQQLNWQICKSFCYPITKGKVLTKTWLMVDNKVMWWLMLHRFRVHTTICCTFDLKLTKCRHKTCNSFKINNPPKKNKKNQKQKNKPKTKRHHGGHKLVFQATPDGFQQYLCPQSKADSLTMSASLSVKSKSLAFSCIRSAFDDFGSTATPCCTAHRSSTCAGVRWHCFATSRTTGSVIRSPWPKEEYAWKQTPYSLQTLFSSAWHRRGWNSTCRTAGGTLQLCISSFMWATV